MPAKRATIAQEVDENATLEKLTAAQFLQVLDAKGVGAHLAYWPEKKKYELYVEPENLNRIPVGRFIDILRGEKKKVELEKLPGFERWQNPIDLITQPAFFDQLVDRVAAAVEARLGR